MADNKLNNPSKKLEEAKKIANRAKNSIGIFDGFEEKVLRAYRWFSALLDRTIFQSKYVGLLSLALALFLYATVNFTNYNNASSLSSSKSLSNVSVSARYNSESFEVSGLPTSCNVIITGDAANVNNAATRNGYCLINLEGYTEGTHTVSLTTSGFGDSVSTTVTPSEAQITLKRKTTSQFEVSFDFINRNSLDSRFILGTPEFESGSKVNIRASQDTLNTIAMVRALIDVSGMSEGENNFTANLVAYNSKGQQVNAEIVPNTISGKLRVSKPNKTVPIVLKVTGSAPTGFALDSVTMDHQSTTIYAPQSVLDSINEVSVTLDLSTITTDANIMLPITLPNGVNASDVTMVNVSATLSTVQTKEIKNVPIVYRNNDNNLGASEIEFTSVTVTVYGSASSIEGIGASDVVVYIDLKDSDGNYLQPGSYDLPIKVEKNTTAVVDFTCEPTHLNITLVGQE